MGTDKRGFGCELLKKFGWTEGKGLGRDESGITAPIRAKLKFNTSGFGFKESNDLNNHWWDSLYNTSANNISVSKSDSGKIHIKTVDKSVSRKAVTSKSYSSFVSGGSLVGSQMKKSKKIRKQLHFHSQKNGSILLDKNIMSKIHNGISNFKRPTTKLTRIQQHDQQQSGNKKKGVSFANKIFSFRPFNKKKSILQDFGNLRSIFKNEAKISCLKKISAYSPKKKKNPTVDSDKKKIKNKKKNGYKSRNGDHSMINDYSLIEQSDQTLPNKIKNNSVFKLVSKLDSGHVTVNGKNKKRRRIKLKKLKRLNKRIKDKVKNGYQSMNSESSDQILAKKIKNTSVLKLDSGLESDNLILNNDIDSIAPPVYDDASKLKQSMHCKLKKRKRKLHFPNDDSIESESPPSKILKTNDNTANMSINVVTNQNT